MPNCSSNAEASRSGSFSAAHRHDAQAAELLRRAAAHVKLQKRRRRQEERHFVVADQRADRLGIERIGVINRAHTQHRRQTKGAGETERMEKRQHAEETIPPVQAEDLFHLLDVRADVVMAQHDPCYGVNCQARRKRMSFY